MPVKSRYWKDPAKHRLEKRLRVKKLVRLGFTGGLTNYSTYLKRLAYHKRWLRTDRGKKLNSKSSQRYRDKIRAAGFSLGSFGRYLYARTKGTLRDGYNKFQQLAGVQEPDLPKNSGKLSKSAKHSPSKTNHNKKRPNNILRRKPRKG